VVTLSVALRLARGGFRLEADFEAPPGITAVFGPSGAGKTLTLRAVAGLERADGGRIALGPRVLADAAAGVHLAPRERRIGYVFQQYALFPHLSVLENVTYGLAALPRADRVARGRELLARVGLGGYEARRPRELSGGEQQRVALVRALANGPELLLLDEPFAALDQRVRRRLRAELLELHRVTGTPMLLVTHDLAEVRQLAGHLVLYEAGRVLRAGPTAEVLADPGGDAAAELLAGGCA
jgi:molybdate transport system ATP-binding protein